MKYYLATYKTNQWRTELIFKNHQELIDFLLLHQTGTKSDRYWNNQYLDELNMNFNDIGVYYFGDDKRMEYVYPYLFFDEDGVIIDVRLLYDEIIKNSGNPLAYDKREINHSFRREPVPNLRKRRKDGRKRNIKYGKIVRDLKNPEYKEYHKKSKYPNFLDVWNELPYKHADRCWKTSFKCNKQWQKHKK